MRARSVGGERRECVGIDDDRQLGARHEVADGRHRGLAPSEPRTDRQGAEAVEVA